MLNNLEVIEKSLEMARKQLSKVNETELSNLNTLIKEINNIKALISPSITKTDSVSANMLSSVASALMKCSFSISPGTYISNKIKILTYNMPSSNIFDSKIGVNIIPFTGCTNPTSPLKNPFAMPWPCLPQLTPFIATNLTCLLDGFPITTKESKAMCTFAPGGVVSFLNSGQNIVKTN